MTNPTPQRRRGRNRRRVRVLRPGRLPYEEGLALQKRIAEGVRLGSEPQTLTLLEHEPVITLGRGAGWENVLVSEEVLAQRGIALFKTDRGGDVTYHGPGQVVAYPILDLSPDRCDVRRYVGDLERTMSRVCADYGLAAGPKEKMVGCWLGGDHGPGPWRKIGAIGVHISRWITTHGLAFNVSPDPSHFALIVPCGIGDHPVTSLAAELGEAPPLEEVMARMQAAFQEVFDADLC